MKKIRRGVALLLTAVMGFALQMCIRDRPVIVPPVTLIVPPLL